jgi:hypothetical protein
LDANNLPNDIEVYPDTGHGFLNDHPRDEMPLWLWSPASSLPPVITNPQLWTLAAA